MAVLMSGDIDEISNLIGKLQGSVDTVLHNQHEQGKDIKRINRSMITVELGQHAVEGRIERQELELATLKESLEKRIRPLEGLRKNILWAWGVIGTIAGAGLVAVLRKVLG